MEDDGSTPVETLTALNTYLKANTRPEIKDDVQRLIKWIFDLDIKNRADAYKFCPLEEMAIFAEVTPAIKNSLQNVGKTSPYCFLLPSNILDDIDAQYINNLQDFQKRYPHSFTDELIQPIIKLLKGQDVKCEVSHLIKLLEAVTKINDIENMTAVSEVCTKIFSYLSGMDEEKEDNNN